MIENTKVWYELKQETKNFQPMLIPSAVIYFFPKIIGKL